VELLDEELSREGDSVSRLSIKEVEEISKDESE